LNFKVVKETENSEFADYSLGTVLLWQEFKSLADIDWDSHSSPFASDSDCN
jgi:hypothetical protein